MYTSYTFLFSSLASSSSLSSPLLLYLLWLLRLLSQPYPQRIPLYRLRCQQEVRGFDIIYDSECRQYLGMLKTTTRSTWTVATPGSLRTRNLLQMSTLAYCSYCGLDLPGTIEKQFTSPSSWRFVWQLSKSKAKLSMYSVPDFNPILCRFWYSL